MKYQETNNPFSPPTRKKLKRNPLKNLDFAILNEVSAIEVRIL